MTFLERAKADGQPDADPFDLLCHLAFNAPALTRRQRADRVKRQQAALFHYYQPEAERRKSQGQRLNAKAAGTRRILAFSLQPSALSCSHHGNVNEIIGKFGGADQLRSAVNQLQSLLYAA